MTTLETISYTSWISGTNAAARAYRADRDNTSPECCLAIRGIFYNATLCLVHTLLSIPEAIYKGITCNHDPVNHWAKAKGYLTFTWICLRILFSTASAHEYMRELVARSCFSALMTLESPDADSPAIAFNCPEEAPQLQAQKLRSHLTSIYQTLTTEGQKKLLDTIKQAITTLADGPAFDQLMYFLSRIEKDAATTQFFEAQLKKTVERTGRVLIVSKEGQELFMRKEAVELAFPSHIAVSEISPSWESAKLQGYQVPICITTAPVFNFAEKINKIYIGESNRWAAYHTKLAEDLSFLNQLIKEKKQDTRIEEFLAYALHTWQEVFQSSHKISSATDLTRYLMLLLKKGNIQSIEAHCKIMRTHAAQMAGHVPVAASDANVELEQLWETIKNTVSMEICLILFETKLFVPHLPDCLYSIYERAYITACKMKEKAPKECDKILTLLYANQSGAEHELVEIFSGQPDLPSPLATAMECKLPELLHTCLIKILESYLFASKSLREIDHLLFAKALHEYVGPRDTSPGIAAEAVALLKYAKVIEIPVVTQQIYAYLKKHPNYSLAAKTMFDIAPSLELSEIASMASV